MPTTKNKPTETTRTDNLVHRHVVNGVDDSLAMKVPLVLVVVERLLCEWTVPVFAFSGHVSGRKRSRKVVPSMETAAKHINTTAATTLEYSPNFRRHIVRQNGKVVKSFAWLDEALEAYPKAQRIALPLQVDVAGAGTDLQREQAYPVVHHNQDDNDNASVTTSVSSTRKTLQSTLQWYDSQIDAILETCPYLRSPGVAPYLQERLHFLLAPLVPSSHSDENENDENDGSNKDSNKNNNVHNPYPDEIHVRDWPVVYYKYGYGAGLTVAQLSHALTVVPRWLLAELEMMNDDTVGSSEERPTIVDSLQLRQARFLYQETPAVVLEVTSQQLPGLYGAAAADAVACAYLHWKGWEFAQIRALLQALPGTLTTALEVSWEVLERAGTNRYSHNANGVRKMLRPDALRYLSNRLQLQPNHWQAILKTHPAVSYYRQPLLQRNCDALQTTLELKSNELRALILRMPSVLGMSMGGLEDRRHFWIQAVGLSLPEWRTAVHAYPSLLQYSVTDNLQPKLDFFQHTLGWPSSAVQSITVAHTQLWGRSLEQHWQPLTTGFCRRCDNLTTTEFGAILRQAPELAACNWKQNLLVKLNYLADRLDLSPTDLATIVSQTPRILMRSIGSVLQPNLDLLLEVASSPREARRAVLDKPSLLLTPPATLAERLHRVQALTGNETTTSTTTFLTDALATTAQNRRRSTRVVHLMRKREESVIEQTFQSVAEAAAHAQVSKSYMYQVLRQGRELGGRRYTMADAIQTMTTIPASSKRASTTSSSSSSSLPKRTTSLSNATTTLTTKLTIYTAARAVPSEARLRGRRRAGGLALQVTEWRLTDWKQVVPRLWKGQKYKLLDQVLLLGYAYTRPSRTRCSLYAVKEALRAAVVWLPSQNGTTSRVVELEIVTDSNRYVLLLLLLLLLRSVAVLV